MTDHDLVARIDAIRAERTPAAPPTDPAIAQHHAGLDNEVTTAWNAAWGIDPLIDRTLKDVRARALEVEAVAEQVAADRREVEAGRVDRGLAEDAIRRMLEREEKRTALLIDTARKAAEVGQERIVAALLPEPSPNGSTTRERKDDLALIVAGYKEPTDGITAAARKAIARDDKVTLGLLVGDHGEALYRARGGDPEGWADLRRSLLRQVAEHTTRTSPRSREARAWKVALGGPDGGNPIRRYLDVENARITRRLKDIPR